MVVDLQEVNSKLPQLHTQKNSSTNHSLKLAHVVVHLLGPGPYASLNAVHVGYHYYHKECA